MIDLLQSTIDAFGLPPEVAARIVRITVVESPYEPGFDIELPPRDVDDRTPTRPKFCHGGTIKVETD